MLTVKKAKEYLQKKHGIEISINTMNQWRSNNKGPVYCKLPGSNRVYYLREHLDDFVAASIKFRAVDGINSD